MNSNQKKSIRRLIRIVWITFGVSFLIWQFYSFTAQGFDRNLEESDSQVVITDEAKWITFVPQRDSIKNGVLFFPGGGVDPLAYLPLNRKLAENHILSIIVKLPYRFAPFESHKKIAVETSIQIKSNYPKIKNWIVCGHSKGGEMAAMLVQKYPERINGLVLLGTSHPKRFSLSGIKIPVKKIYATNDGVAALPQIKTTATNLPDHTQWFEIKGGNHSQFGYYGFQLGDDDATISRDEQQEIVFQEILKAIAESEK
ncbi:alpha/beta fold hydrolase [candidate division KSB1 bacterium]|nr:alpha/beta fold hydrolase [candidate division KSB1 bacterium]